MKSSYNSVLENCPEYTSSQFGFAATSVSLVDYGRQGMIGKCEYSHNQEIDYYGANDYFVLIIWSTVKKSKIILFIPKTNY